MRRGSAAAQGRPRRHLDPFATGLLIVLVGSATKVQWFVMGLPKRYEATAARCARRPPAIQRARSPSPDVCREGDLELPTGAIRQRPPAYSAVKIKATRVQAGARR